MSETQRVVPAQLSFLAIYNPSLGPSEETFREQVVFYYSRVAQEERAAARKTSRKDGAGGDGARQEENEKLRQIGLAQGMVDFARSFSNGEPVDSIETEKSRIVLHELEKGWWILASIDLTRLPSISHTPSEPSRKGGDKLEPKPTIEYSSREVSTPALLVQQLLQAHYVFCLHHGPSLSDLYVRMPRDRFCNILDRFWARFSRSWDVLLHGNPAADIFSGFKLASGGELGFGVGEEEWGSGEREVLEDLTRRTEGLVDLVAARFGEPAPAEQAKSDTEHEELPWMGRGTEPIASDGIIFGGINAVERHSLRDVSLWMRQIYTYGEHAYGVRDNPLRERRKRRRRNPPEHSKPTNGSVSVPRSRTQSEDPKNLRKHVQRKEAASGTLNQQVSPGLTMVVEDKRPEIYPRVASHDHATTPEETPTPPSDQHRPSIPPPIISAAEQALQKATEQANSKSASETTESTDESGTTLGIPDQYMKYLTFGLSTLAKPAPKRPSTSRQASGVKPTLAAQTDVKAKKSKHLEPAEPVAEEDDMPMMTHLEPIPDGETLKARIHAQKRQEQRGHFVIGFKGDLSEIDELSDDEVEDTDGSFYDEADGSRIVLRTLHVEVKPTVTSRSDDDKPQAPSRTSSAAYVNPVSEATKDYRRLRVLVYVHQPFMYCFLFEPRTSSLQYTNFYKTLHRNLMPIHKPLLSSTSVAKISQFIENSHATQAESASGSTSSAANKLPYRGSNTSPVYDLLYDPRLLTLHTSLPNIPEPGTPAAEGIFTGFRSGEAPLQAWTRIEALNVHSQILNTLASVRTRKHEIERTSKTSRGWWVVWMKVPPSTSNQGQDDESQAVAPPSSSHTVTSTTQVEQVSDHQSSTHQSAAPHPSPAGQTSNSEQDLDRIAFLVRKASDTTAAPAKTTSSSSRAMSSMFSNMSLGLVGSTEEETTGGASAGWGPSALAGGIGMDARKYVEGLLSLNR